LEGNSYLIFSGSYIIIYKIKFGGVTDES